MVDTIREEYKSAPKDALRTPGADKAEALPQCREAFKTICVYIQRMSQQFDPSPVLDTALSNVHGIRNDLAKVLLDAGVNKADLKRLHNEAKAEAS